MTTWRNRIYDEVLEILAEYHLPEQYDLASAIAANLPSPDERNGYAIVPLEPTQDMLAAARDAVRPLDNTLAIAAMHGATVEWVDGKPPLWHAYKAMVAAAQ